MTQPGPPAVQRFALLPTTRHVLPVAMGSGLLVALLAQGGAVRLGFLLASLLALLLWALLRALRPQLLLTAAGYRVEVRGKERFFVPWSAVTRVLCDRREGALYVDCGDRERNLLLPPARGFAFTFSERERLFAAVLAAVPDRVEEVEDLAPAATGKKST